MDNIIEGNPIPTSVVADLDKPLSQYLVHISKNSKNRVFVTDVLTGKQLTVGDAMEQSFRLAFQLKKLGCKPGQVISVISENRLEVPVVILAALHAGVIISCLNPSYSEGELKHTLNLVTPFIIFSSGQCYDKVGKAYNGAKYIINFDEYSNRFSYYKLIQDAVGAQYVPPDVSPDSTAMILFSSGSSGLPKGVMLKNSSFVFLLELKRFTLRQLEDVETASRALYVIPMFHGYGVMILLTSLSSYADSIYCLSKFNEELFLSSIPKHKITSLLCVPPLMVFLAKHPIVDNYDLSSVNRILCGAAPLSTDIEKSVLSKFPNVEHILKSYGMTETTVVCTSTVNDPKDGSVGRLLPGFLAKIVDVENGQALGPMKEGEICMKGPFLMKGYYRNEKETAAVFDEDGWLHTGDVGYYDEDELLFIVDRIKDLIKYKGFQVPPAEIESLLLKHPAVKEAAVIGIPDDLAGELPKAFIVKQPTAQVTVDELLKHVSDQVAPHMKLRGGIAFIDEIPKNQTGKILRRELRKLAKSKI